ncbi:MAG: outer membrane beta-barrel protein [Hyphomicrobiales bacterium]
MSISKNSIIFKSFGVVAALCATTSLAFAGDVADGAKPLPEGQYEASLLGKDSNYPDVGLRKQTNQDCYCTGAYFGLSGGYSYGNEGRLSKGTPVVVNPAAFNEVLPQLGMSGKSLTGSVSAGYKFSAFRVEVSGEYRSHAAWSGSAAGVSINAKTQQYGMLMSAFYDIEVPGIPVMPYVGLGAGLALSKTKYGIDLTTGGATTSATVDFSRGASFMGAAMAGVAVNVTDNITLDLGYRMMNIAGGTATYDGSTNAANLNAVAGGNIVNVAGMATNETLVYPSLLSHEVRAGLRYRF